MEKKEKRRYVIWVSEKTYKKIHRYRLDNNLSSATTALEELLERGKK